MNIELWSISRPIPYENNPRDNSAAVAKVAASIAAFGFQQPLVVDVQDVLIVGHTRLLAALQLGLKEVPVLVADKLTPAQVAAYRIADNKTQEFSSWNQELLIREIEELQLSDFPVKLTGFDIQEIAELFKGSGDLLEPRGDKEMRRSALKRLTVKFGETTVPITAEEDALLSERLRKYTSAVGESRLFVRSLLHEN